MEALFDIPIMSFKDTTAWESWLSDNYTLQTGVWIKVAKKDSGIASVTTPEALDVALCYGWIDGQRRSLDAHYYLQKYTPRRQRSLWSKVNIGKVEALIANGGMQAPGLKAIAEAQADGRWDAAYESQKNATVPPDLEAALEQNKQARSTFEDLTRADRYAYLWSLMTAKTTEIRATRLQKIIHKLEANEG
jgi:uncharacterized protein YdeI (YjbR/CyaY-like superfamily)